MTGRIGTVEGVIDIQALGSSDRDGGLAHKLLLAEDHRSIRTLIDTLGLDDLHLTSIVVGRSIVVPDREVIETTLKVEVLSIGHLQLDVARRVGVDARRASIGPDLNILEVEEVALVELHVDEIDLDRIHVIGLRPYEGDVA